MEKLNIDPNADHANVMDVGFLGPLLPVLRDELPAHGLRNPALVEVLPTHADRQRAMSCAAARRRTLAPGDIHAI